MEMRNMTKLRERKGERLKLRNSVRVESVKSVPDTSRNIKSWAKLLFALIGRNFANRQFV